MNQPKLIDRFLGESGRRLLIECLSRQWLLREDDAIATLIADKAELRELDAGEVLIRQGDAESDVYFILTGRLRILVDQQEVAIRGANQHVGEMALIDPSLPRTATNIAAEPTVVAKVPESEFAPIADANPRIWRALGSELSRRLNQQGSFLAAPNRIPHLLIRSSSENLAYADALALEIPGELATVRVCTREIFDAEHFPIEELEAQLRVADFAVLVAPDDQNVAGHTTGPNPVRDNVVFEVGLLMGALSRHRTYLVTPVGSTLGIPTDLLGLTPILYTPQDNPSAAIAGAAEELCAIIRSMGSR
ncbi:MAG: TIR domain-containing protein [Verrucomicrobiota bacterium]